MTGAEFDPSDDRDNFGLNDAPGGPERSKRIGPDPLHGAGDLEERRQRWAEWNEQPANLPNDIKELRIDSGRDRAVMADTEPGNERAWFKMSNLGAVYGSLGLADSPRNPLKRRPWDERPRTTPSDSSKFYLSFCEEYCCEFKFKSISEDKARMRGIEHQEKSGHKVCFARSAATERER